MKTKPTIRNRYLLLLDLFLITVAVLSALALRVELGPLFFFYLPFAYWVIGVALVVKPLVYFGFGMYRRMWVYASIKELRLITLAVSVACIATYAVVVVLYSFKVFHGFVRSVFIIDWLLSILLVGGVRLLPRLIAESSS